MPHQNIKIILAPLRGVTDYHFRRILPRHFAGFNCAVAPFISPQAHSEFPDKMLKDILPQNNAGLAIIPQLLHSRVAPFLILAQRMAELGYRHLNWNLGCPAPQVAKKGRGAGLLPYSEEICRILDEVIPQLEKLGCTLSIKMRLGYHSNKESSTLLPMLNNYPLEEIIIHPRLGKQLYKGDVDLEGFTRCMELCRHPLIYNGDITSVEKFFLLKRQLPTVSGWMIGRGAIAAPFLAEEIKGVEAIPSTMGNRLAAYHQELFSCYSHHFSGPGHLLSRMKLIWGYLISSFPAQQNYLKKIYKSATIEKYQQVVEEIFTQGQ